MKITEKGKEFLANEPITKEFAEWLLKFAYATDEQMATWNSLKTKEERKGFWNTIPMPEIRKGK